LGLGRFYFAIAGIMGKSTILSLGLSVILLFVGSKIVIRTGFIYQPEYPKRDTRGSCSLDNCFIIREKKLKAKENAYFRAGSVQTPGFIAWRGPFKLQTAT
jgi:predicted tellurium resistance membrane protein TerC